MEINKRIESVAVIGAGASGAVTSAALDAEKYFKRIRVFERREAAGGTWIYDAAVSPGILITPGLLPPELDPGLKIPGHLPQTTPPVTQERFSETPIYENLTTNVPDIAMSYSDIPFPYGPFVPHHIPKQYIENYFSAHGTDSFLELNTTVEDLSRVPSSSSSSSSDHSDRREGWKLTLRRRDVLQKVDHWWEEYFDAVILANGHYTIPSVPRVKGLDEYMRAYPGRVIHSKTYRNPSVWAGKKVLVVGNSASGIDITRGLREVARLPVYQSRRSRSRWDGDEPPPGVEWKPVVTEYLSDGADPGRILFSDGSHLDGVDVVVYCTGYRPSFPFWNTAANGRPMYDYAAGKLVNSFQHTFFRDFATLGIVGMPRVLTFRSMEYQAVALARLFAGRLPAPLPSVAEQEKWERERAERQRAEGNKFHDIAWETGETVEWLTGLFRMAGLGTLSGRGRLPPVLDDATVKAINDIKKYPEPGHERELNRSLGRRVPAEGDWVVVDRPRKDLLSFL
ncbi:hypothetical protein N3K66_006379 [Trichothecium roseum]|uniref:Uncharacterized protein n=1 Tax=Trichothecium roseum TaxID=47278 RepID=A0ACC0UVA4_9HYPO|nr:hypothetical protein N3K66_006379 [Trichothecium roseum]